MSSRSINAFLPIATNDKASIRLDFAAARLFVAGLFPDGKVADMYNAHELHMSDAHSVRPYSMLTDWERKSAAWRFAGPTLEDGLLLGKFPSYLVDPKNGLLLLIPREYWTQPGLEFPTDSRLQLMDLPWTNFAHLAGATMFIVEADLQKAFAGVPPARRGRTPKYDWPTFEAHLYSLLDDNGLPSSTDPGWSSQADIERTMLEWSMTHWGAEPSQAQCRRHVSTTISRFARARVLGQK